MENKQNNDTKNNDINNVLTNNFDNIIITDEDEESILIDSTSKSYDLNFQNSNNNNININNIINDMTDNNIVDSNISNNNISNNDVYIEEENLDEEFFAETDSKDPLDALDRKFSSSTGKEVVKQELKLRTQEETTEQVKEQEEAKEQAEEVEEPDDWCDSSKKITEATDEGAKKVSSKEQAEKAEQIDKLKGTLGENSNTEQEFANNPSNLAKASLLSIFMPGKHVNKRLLGVLGCGLLAILIIFISNSQKNATSKDRLRTLPPPEEARSVGKENIDTAELSPAHTRYSPKEEAPPPPTPTESIPQPVAQLPPVTIPPTVAPLPTPKPEEEKKDFGLELRAGTAAALKTINAPAPKTEEEKGQEAFLEGVSIQMMLLEPFRSGISTLVKAQVITEVKNPKGEIVVPVGSRVQIPFERFEVDGRVVNNSQDATVIILPTGKKLTVKGLVKGIDGFAGIKGNVKKLSKGNIFSRVGKTFTRVGARIVGVETGGFAGRGIEDTINESVDSNSQYIATGRTVEILPGTRFSFNVN